MKKKTMFSILCSLLLASNCIVAMDIPAHRQTDADFYRGLAESARDRAYAPGTELGRQQYWMMLAAQFRQRAAELRQQEPELPIQN